MSWFDNPSNILPLLAFGQAMSQAAGPSAYPVSMGQALGQGAAGAMQGMAMGRQWEGQQRQRSQEREQENLRRKLFGMPPLPEEESAPFGFGSLFGGGEPEKAAAPAGGGPQPTSQLASAGMTSASGAPYGVPGQGGGQNAPLAGLAAKYNMDPQSFYAMATTMPGMLPLMQPEQQDLPDGMWYDAQGNPTWVPGYQEGKVALAQASRPVTNVSISNTTEGAFNKGVGEHWAKFYGDVMDGSKTAQGTLASLDQMNAILDAGARTGSLAGMEEQVGSFLTALGLDPKTFGLQDPGALQAFAGLGLQSALKYVQSTSGSISNAEMELFIGAAPGLSQTPEGNRLIINATRALAKRDIEMARQLRQWEKQYGSPSAQDKNGNTFLDTWDAYAAQHPVITPDMVNQIKANSGYQQGQQQVAPAAPPAAGAQPLGQPQGSSLPVITKDAAGQAAYDALPSGSVFTDPDGNRWTKP